MRCRWPARRHAFAEPAVRNRLRRNGRSRFRQAHVEESSSQNRRRRAQDGNLGPNERRRRGPTPRQSATPPGRSACAHHRRSRRNHRPGMRRHRRLDRPNPLRPRRFDRSMPLAASPVGRDLGLFGAPQPADDYEKKMHVTSTPTQGGFLLLRTIQHPSQSPGADSSVVADTLLIFILPKFFMTATPVCFCSGRTCVDCRSTGGKGRASCRGARRAYSCLRNRPVDARF